MIDRFFEMINQEFEAPGTKYEVLPNLGVCCRELRELEVTSFHACVFRFCSVTQSGTGQDEDDSDDDDREVELYAGEHLTVN